MAHFVQRTAIGLTLVLAAAGCKPQPAAQLNVVDAHARLPAVADRPTGVFLTVRGGEQPVRLLAVTTTLARRAEIHDTVLEGGMISMKPVASVDIPAKGTVTFDHGGKHVMVWGINAQAIKAGKLPMTFIFSNKDRIVADVRLDPPLTGGAAMDHSGNDHMHQR